MSQTITLKYNRLAYAEEDLLTGIRENKEWAIREIYKNQYNGIKKMVYTFKNTTLDPEDIFQDGLTRAIMNIRAGKFNGDSSFTTYLNSICRNICLKELSRNKAVPMQEIPIPEEKAEDNYYELLVFINQLKNKLGTSCREIIDLRFKQADRDTPEPVTDNKLSGFEEIATQLQITPANARQRFKRCLDQLREMVFSHPDYQTLFD